ncbi:MAG TPA: DNA-processing protein DprA [Acidobacteriota bacterium]
MSDIDPAAWRNSSATALLALHLACEVGGRRMVRLLGAFGSAEAALAAGPARLAGLLSATAAGRIAAAGWIEAAQREETRARELGLELLFYGRPGYPRYLEQLPDPPPVLYVRGRLALDDERAIAVVGSRSATPYGLSVTRALVRELAQARITIVSGLARGIDAAAHRAALRAGGRTLAVLGSGLDRLYPPDHAALADEVAASGAVLSEYPLGTRPMPTHFPVRNRIIAGLALATVVVEAAAKSGALITARLANDYGRSVHAVPGNVTSRLSAGPNELIRQGALLIQSAAEVVSALGWSLPPQSAAASEPLAAAPEIAILAALEPRGEACSIDQLCERLGRSPQELLPLLVGLEARGAIESVPGMRFLRPLGSLL